MGGDDGGLPAGDLEGSDVVALLNDEYARAVLRETYDRARPVEDLIDRVDAAPSTIYDRLSRLTETDLVVERQAIDPDGHHHKTYRACLDQVLIELTADGFTVHIDRTPTDPADRLTDAFDRLRE